MVPKKDLKPTDENDANFVEGKSKDHQIDDGLQSLVEGLPAEKQKAFQTLFLQIRRTLWKSPYPPPDFLLDYNDIIQNGAERIFHMVEKEADHIMEIEKLKMEKLAPVDQRQSKWGQIFAFIITSLFVLTAGFLIWQGHDMAGTILGSVNLIALVSVFVYGKKEQEVKPLKIEV